MSTPIELPESPSWDWDAGGLTGRRQWQCDWADIRDDNNLASWVPVPYQTMFPYGSGMICTKISVIPIQSAAGNGEYLSGLITADYASSTLLEGLPVISSSGCVELLETGAGRTYNDDGTPCSVSQTMMVYIQRKNVDYLVDRNSTIEYYINNRVNKVNSNAFSNYNAGSVIMEAPDISEYTHPATKIIMMKIGLRYVIRLDGYSHNAVWNAATGNWTETTPALYQSTHYGSLVIS